MPGNDPSYVRRGATIHDMQVQTEGNELVITADVEGTRREIIREEIWFPDNIKPMLSVGITPLGILTSKEAD